ncbi:MAG: GNAT family protein [Candidatus Acidiferrum sp.]
MRTFWFARVFAAGSAAFAAKSTDSGSLSRSPNWSSTNQAMRLYHAQLMNTEMLIEPVTLEGRHVRLEPLSQAHQADLSAEGLDEALWRWIPVPVRTPEEMSGYIRTALDEQARGVSLPFALIEKAGNRAIGSTRYGSIDRAHRRVEIGWTWIAAAWQRSAVNTEAKYLLLRHAFETLGCIRVELKTDSLNERSRTAILRIGAREEGTFRNHMITASGRVRHTVYFSILDSEWPAVKSRLQNMLLP